MKTCKVGDVHVEHDRIEIFAAENLERAIDVVCLMWPKPYRCQSGAQRRSDGWLVFYDQYSGRPHWVICSSTCRSSSQSCSSNLRRTRWDSSSILCSTRNTAQLLSARVCSGTEAAYA
jgi:hypothetical protein